MSIDKDITTEKDFLNLLKKNISSAIDCNDVVEDLKYELINKKLNINDFDLIERYKKSKLNN